MLIDHIGLVFFPRITIFRIIGRISFPLFAYHITVGYKNTSSLKNYYKRLTIFAFISQIPYMFFVSGRLNIFFTLLLGLTAIYFYDKNIRLLSIILILLGQAFKVSYGAYGVAMILLFYLFYEAKYIRIIAISIITIIYSYIFKSPLQLYSILALFILLKEWHFNIRLNKYIYYSFYPLHIAILLLINRLI